MFKITHNKGFHIKFANGYNVSVQWGGGNLCENRHLDYVGPETPVPASATAEVAVWDKDGQWVSLSPYDVIGYQTPEQVAAIIADFASR